MAMKRICKEYEQLNNGKNKLPDNIELKPDGENLSKWFAIIEGGNDSLYKGLKFRLEININEDYPRKPPSVKFISKCFHPNVYRDGKICLSTLQSGWSPINKLTTVLISIQSLLDDPNISSPANLDASIAFKLGKEQFIDKIHQYYEY